MDLPRTFRSLDISAEPTVLVGDVPTRVNGLKSVVVKWAEATPLVGQSRRLDRSHNNGF